MKFVSREEWGARPPNDSYSSIDAHSTTAHWEGPHMGSFGHDQCAPKVRSIQSFHMDSQGWDDIGYNAVACPHGYVFEGRGPGHRSAANGTNEANDSSYAVCYLGGEGDDFPAEAQAAMADAAAWLGPPMTLGHRDWIATACPGDVIYGWVHAGVPGGDAGAPPTPISGPAPPFPYPPDNYLGQPSSDPACHSEGDAVRQWQGRMDQRGWSLDVDGLYGPESSGVARSFQAEKGLAVDGLVGPETWTASWEAPVT